MELRLLGLAAFLACNALFLIWRTQKSRRERNRGALKATLEDPVAATSPTGRAGKNGASDDQCHEQSVGNQIDLPPLEPPLVKRNTGKENEGGSGAGSSKESTAQPIKDDAHSSQVVTADKNQPKLDNSFLDDPESIALRRTLGEQESIELAPGLVAELFTIAADGPGSPDQSLKISLSMLPFQSDTDNSPLQSEAAFEALVKTAKVVLAVKHLEVDFEICPPSQSTPDPNTIDTQPDIKTGRFGSASKLFTSRYPAHMAGLLGAANPRPTHAGLNDNERC